MTLFAPTPASNPFCTPEAFCVETRTLDTKWKSLDVWIRMNGNFHDIESTGGGRDGQFSQAHAFAQRGMARSGCCRVRCDVARLCPPCSGGDPPAHGGDIGERDSPGQPERRRKKGPDRSGRNYSGSWLPLFRDCGRRGPERELVCASDDPAWHRCYDQSVWSRRSRSAP